MNTRAHPSEIASSILWRSPCRIKVGAVIEDSNGAYSWSWNHTGFDGLGEHAEQGAIRRANKGRLEGSIIWVATIRQRNKKVINSRPCDKCQELIESYGLRAIYRDAKGEWVKL
jgi:cytidine deaminase